MALRLPSWSAAYPGAVLHVSPQGIVTDSNGRLERELDRVAIGRPFTEVLDAESSAAKWNRLLADVATTADPTHGTTGELILCNGDTLLEPRAFSVLWDAEASRVLVLEHATDPRLDDVRQQVTGVNSELANTQRDLVRERSHLAQALERADRLTGQVKSQNEQLSAQNEELLVMTEELSEQRHALERSNKVLNEFAHAISHDLKAPLRSVANYARWIEEDLGNVLTGEPRAHMELLRSQVERMREMISSVLEYARAIRTGGRTEMVDIQALVREVIAVIHPPAGCEIHLAPDLPVFETERAPLRQVLLNLIGNAIKHSGRPDPRVEIGCSDTGSSYDFFVRDNGRGIAPRAQEKIWMLFQTGAPRDGRDDVEGTGVGLAIVRQLVETHGGRTWVESTEGSGATFHFLWPKHSVSPKADSPPAASSLSLA